MNARTLSIIGIALAALSVGSTNASAIVLSDCIPPIDLGDTTQTQGTQTSCLAPIVAAAQEAVDDLPEPDVGNIPVYGVRWGAIVSEGIIAAVCDGSHMRELWTVNQVMSFGYTDNSGQWNEEFWTYVYHPVVRVGPTC